jgi:predicted DNA-binding transcriptional regulator YafY
MILKAVREQRRLKITFESGKGYSHKGTYTPRKIEYSEKDDKFRLICCGKYEIATINIARISKCQILESFDIDSVKPLKRKKDNVILHIHDERNALERSMLHFANFEKRTEQIDEKNYKMELSYNTDDETEVLIRVMSFGPMIKAVYPEKYINLIIVRLESQKKLR